MKKKLWCVLCIMACMMMIAACGQKKAPEKKKTEQAETKFKDRENLKLNLFTVYYPKAWNYDKENMKKDKDYARVRFFDGDTVDESENVIYIEATKEDSYKYRNSLVDFGVDLETYAKGKMDTVTIGNAEYTAMPESNSAEKGPFSMLDDVQITNSHIMVAGSMAAEDEGTKIIVYDYEGNQLLKLGGEDISSKDKLGSITGMAETENGFVAADGNMREIQFWAKDGTHIGAISTDDIFGVSYPWLEDMQLLDDGSLLIMLTQERDDGSANELMFFRLTGF